MKRDWTPRLGSSTNMIELKSHQSLHQCCIYKKFVCLLCILSCEEESKPKQRKKQKNQQPENAYLIFRPSDVQQPRWPEHQKVFQNLVPRRADHCMLRTDARSRFARLVPIDRVTPRSEAFHPAYFHYVSPHQEFVSHHFHVQNRVLQSDEDLHSVIQRSCHCQQIDHCFRYWRASPAIFRP